MKLALIQKIVKGSDLIIIASTLSSYKNIILKIKSSLKNGAILTDVGSVKKNAISLIEKNIPKNNWFPHTRIFIICYSNIQRGTKKHYPKKVFCREYWFFEM